MNPHLSPQILFVFTSLCILVSTAAVIFNGIIIITVAKNKSLQVLENTFLLNLAGLDVLSGFVNLCYPAVWNNDHSTQCVWLIAFTAHSVNATFLQVTVMTLDKYIRIVHPFMHINICNKRNVYLVTGFVHMFAVSSMFIAFFLYNKNDSTICSAMFAYSDEIYLIIQAIIFVNISGIALINIRILHISQKKKNRVQAFSGNVRQPQSIHGVKVLAVVVMFMFVLYIPAWIQLVLKVAYDLPLDTQVIFTVIALLFWMTAPMVDGIAFLFCRQDIRKCAWKLIRCK